MFAVLPGNHLCSFHALGLPDDADSFLRIVQVLQQHTDGVVPVPGAPIGLESLRVPGGHRRLPINGAGNRTPVSTASLDLLAVRLHGFGVLEVHLWRGDIWEQFSHLQPKRKNGRKMCLDQRRETSRVLTRLLSFFSPVLGANVDGRSLVVVLAFLIELSGFGELL